VVLKPGIVFGSGPGSQRGCDTLYRVATEIRRQTSAASSTVLRTFDDAYDQAGCVTEVADSHSLAFSAGREGVDDEPLGQVNN